MADNYIEVPFEQLETDTLRRLIEEFIERDGTFYGDIELPMEQKVDMVIRQLREKTAMITWDLKTESSNILLKNTAGNH